MTGASGFIGRHLTDFLERRGHRITSLGRSVLGMEAGDELMRILKSCSVVVNLAGAPINHRWNEVYKRELYESRVTTTRRLVETINKLPQPPDVMISASAVGIYSSEGCHAEDSTDMDDSFLADLCRAWENEAAQVTDAVRLVRARFGVVMAPDGGALPSILRPLRFRIAVSAGISEHPWSWIALEDLVRAVDFLINHGEITGAVNMTAPERTTNELFYRMVARHFHAYLTVHVPEFAVHWAMGESAQVITRGHCAVPGKLLGSGFEFMNPGIEAFFRRNFSTDEK